MGRNGEVHTEVGRRTGHVRRTNEHARARGDRSVLEAHRKREDGQERKVTSTFDTSPEDAEEAGCPCDTNDRENGRDGEERDRVKRGLVLVVSGVDQRGGGERPSDEAEKNEAVVESERNRARVDSDAAYGARDVGDESSASQERRRIDAPRRKRKEQPAGGVSPRKDG